MTRTSQITDALSDVCNNTAKPMSKESLQQFVDLGLDDFEIARYYEVETVNVTRLRNCWAIEVDPQIAAPTALARVLFHAHYTNESCHSSIAENGYFRLKADI